MEPKEALCGLAMWYVHRASKVGLRFLEVFDTLWVARGYVLEFLRSLRPIYVVGMLQLRRNHWSEMEN